jgi:hypothetical protein
MTIDCGDSLAISLPVIVDCRTNDQKNGLYLKEIGKVYGHLEVVEAPKRKTNGIVYAKARCICGFVKEYRLSNMKSGNTASCGCKRISTIKSRAKSRGYAASWQCFAQYKKGAQKRGLAFEISFERFLELTSGLCAYCASAPSQIFSLKYAKGTHKGKERLNGSFIYNGIDRVDSSMGYTESNVVSCCKTCNRAKLDYSMVEFYTWASCVANNVTNIKEMILELERVSPR